MKKLIMIGVPLLLLICIAGGLIITGVVKLPGSGKKKPAVVAKTAPAAKPPAQVVEKKPKARPKPKPKLDQDAGDQKVAKLWNEIDTTKLAALIKTWKDPEIARVLIKMDPDKVSELLGSLDPAKASALSRAVQARVAATPPS